jgi:hypothetical protein
MERIEGMGMEMKMEMEAWQMAWLARLKHGLQVGTVGRRRGNGIQRCEMSSLRFGLLGGG